MRMTINLGFTLLAFLEISCSGLGIHPQRKDITDAVFASGNIFDENEYTVTVADDEYLKKSFVKEGDKVVKGMPLFLLSGEIPSALYETAQANYSNSRIKNGDSSPQMQQLKLQIAQAGLQLGTDEANYTRYEKLLKTGAVSGIDFEKVKLQFEASKSNKSILEQSLLDLKRELQLNEKNASAQLSIQKRNQRDYYVAADFDGIVMSISKKQGEYVRRGENIAKLGDGNPIIRLYIAEEDVRLVKLNDKVVVMLNTDKQRTYDAFIRKIYPAFDDKNQSYIAEATFGKIPENLYYNAQLQANIIIAVKKDALIVPAEYVSKGNTLLLENGQEISFIKGISNSNWVEVLEGINEKETIVLHKIKK